MVRVRDGESSSSSSEMTVVKPAWLEGLMLETFFGNCGVHENKKKNEKNIFCLGCCRSICHHCVPSHRSHPLLQVRRYVYHDVVRLGDLEKLIDCSYVQPYTINRAKVVFLNQRPQNRPFKGSGNICFNCDRILQEPFHYCSLSCKVDHFVLQGEDLSSIIYMLDESDFAVSHFESLHMDGSDIMEEDEDQMTTPNSILEDPMSYKSSSSQNNHNHHHRQHLHQNSADSENSTEVKKKKGTGFLPQIVLSLSSRRKGAPHRSPLA
ncbi:hypothetical protein QJS10_CPB22g00303 [Acorus calamus]|uniref:B box-type domain-containing protein n=1 Tax=Acorus calamus TaxID=4465 RepID=A0AAV9C0Q6_ACOCL|nr:hypothetical protein QJS10_CPB22g00303 [Acorus calamus]